MRTARGVLFHPLWNQLQQFQGEMNRLFETWSGNDGGAAPAVFPAVNMWEEDDQVLVEAELPGQDLAALEIYVTGGNQLTIKGDRKVNSSEKGMWHRHERNHGAFSRTVALPFLVNADKVEARLENGVLVIKLAKHESARPRKILVKAQ
jgi:HSP20 family protein